VNTIRRLFKIDRYYQLIIIKFQNYQSQ